MRECRICGDTIPTNFVDNECDGCWEVTHRLDDFLKHPEGRKEILNRLIARENKCKKSG